MSMRILLLAAVCTAFVGCGGDSDKSTKEPNPTETNNVTTPEQGSSGVAERMKVSGPSTVAEGQSIELNIDVASLKTDNPVYLSISSDAIDDGSLTIEPTSSMLYPNKGQLTVLINVTNNRLMEAADLTLLLRTSDNVTVSVNHTLSL